MKKKIIYFVSFITICLLCVAIFNKDEVNAEENCKYYTNYYLFQDATPYGTVKNWGDSYYTTSKAFAVDVPSGATVYDYGQIAIIGDENGKRTFSNDKDTSLIGSKDFYDYYAKLMGTEGNDADSSVIEKEFDTNNNTRIYYDKDNDVYFYASKTYANGSETSAKYVDMPDDYSTYFKRLSPSSFREGNNALETTVDVDNNSDDYFSATVSRKWDSYTVNYLENNADNTYIFSAAVYRVVYEYCDESGTDDPVVPPIEEDPVEKSNKVTTHYYIENTTTKLRDDFVENNVAVGTYTSSCPSTLKYGNKYYDRLLLSVSVEMKEEGEEELICYYREQTYSVTINYGEDEGCTTSIRESDYSDGYKAGQSMLLEVPESIGKLTRPTLGTYSSQIVNKPSLDGKDITFTMPAKDVSICVVYTPQTGSSIVKWIALIGLGALAFTVWNISKKNKEINEEV